MKSHPENIHWEILETHAPFFHKWGLEDPERLIRESRTIKEGHLRTVYLHRSGRFYIKRMRPRKAKKEWRNWQGLYQKGVPTVTPIAAGIGRNHGYLISLMDHPWNGLYEIFDASGYPDRIRLLRKLGEVVRMMHAAGFYHGDLHGGNFLARWNRGQAEIRMVDFQRGRFCRLSYKQRLTNLADLGLSRFFVLGMKERLSFLTGYFGVGASARDFVRREGLRLERLVLKRSDRIADHKVRRFRKVNKYFDRMIVDTPFYKLVYLRKNRERIPSPFLSAPLRFLHSGDVEVLKDTRSVRVIRYHDVCIKYYKRRSPKDVLKSWLGASKGKKSFRSALALLYRDIPTPEPLCYLTGLKGDSFYLSVFFDSTRNLVLYLQEATREQRRTCLESLAFFLKKMFYRGVYHLDCKGSNILVRGGERDFQFCLIDTDEMKIAWKGSRRLLKKNISRITRTLTYYYNRPELIGFVESCLSGLPGHPGPGPSPHELVDRAFEMEAARKPRRVRR